MAQVEWCLPPNFEQSFTMSNEFSAALEKKSFVCWRILHSLMTKLSTANKDKRVCMYVCMCLHVCLFVSFIRSFSALLKSAANEIEHLVTFAWQKIHCGKWDKIDSIWRNLYALACFGKAGILYLGNQLIECVQSLDFGIICGHKMYQKILQSFVQIAHNKLIKMKYAKNEKRQFPVLRFEDDQNEENKNENFMDCEVERPKLCKNNFLCCRHIFDIDLTEFITNYFNKKEPILLKELASNWPVIEKWKNLNYFMDAAGFRLVPIEIGTVYTANDWTTKLMTFGRFLSEHIVSSKNAKTGYLAQHFLFEQIKCFDSDIQIPDFVHVGKSDFEQSGSVNCWFGPKGTVTPIHFDAKHNILCQVVGFKYLRIYSPQQSDFMYARKGMLNNTSCVEFDFDLDSEKMSEKYPKFKDAQYLDVILGPGDAVYLPPKWWHYVKSLSVSFSVSFWFE